MVHSSTTILQGYILLPVVMMIALIAAIALMLDRQGGFTATTASDQQRGMQALAGAAAALQHATWLAQHNACVGDVTTNEITLPSVNYVASLDSPATTTTLTFEPKKLRKKLGTCFLPLLIWPGN